MIKLQVIGNIGNDAKINEVNGRQSINFSVAHNRKFKNQEGVEVEQVTWVNCSFWKNAGQSTEVAKYLISGTRVFVEGIPDIKTFKNREGIVKASLNLSVTNVELLGGKAESNQAEQNRMEEPEMPSQSDDTPY